MSEKFVLRLVRPYGDDIEQREPTVTEVIEWLLADGHMYEADVEDRERLEDNLWPEIFLDE